MSKTLRVDELKNFRNIDLVRDSKKQHTEIVHSHAYHTYVTAKVWQKSKTSGFHIRFETTRFQSYISNHYEMHTSANSKWIE